MKTLKQLLELKKTEAPTPSAPIEPDSVTSYVPKTKDEKRFMDKHIVQKHDDRAGNGDDVFRATNVKAYDRSATRHGYNTKEDQAVYEDKQVKTLYQILGEKHLTPAEMKKREEVAKAMERENPGMDKSKKMAIATATAKRVAESAMTTKNVAPVKAGPLSTERPGGEWDPVHGKAPKKGTVKYDIWRQKVSQDKKGMTEDFDQFNEEFEQLDEAARHSQYSTYHAGVKDMLKKLGVVADAHKEASMSPTEWNKEKGANMGSHHVWTMKNMHRQLQDMHDGLQQETEYAQPPKPVKLKEEDESMFDAFEDDFREKAIAVFNALDEENQQIMLEMIGDEAQQAAVIEIIEEIING